MTDYINLSSDLIIECLKIARSESEQKTEMHFLELNIIRHFAYGLRYTLVYSSFIIRGMYSPLRNGHSLFLYRIIC